MPIMRNPFRRAPGDHLTDENARPVPSAGTINGIAQRRAGSDGFGAKPMSIDLSGDKLQPTEYKLSEINDSGVYLPPSPPEKKGFWSTKSNSSTKSSSHRSILNENEPFNISRESFDSYRRSFDISARSPIIDGSPAQRSRQSFDVRGMRLPSSQSFSTQASFASFASMRSQGLLSHTPSQRSIQTLSSQHPIESTSEDADSDGLLTPATPYDISTSEVHESEPDSSVVPTSTEKVPEPEPDRMEEVPLNDPKPKRYGIFSRFGVGTSTAEAGEGISRPGSSHGFFGRKRGTSTSGQGAELGSMPVKTSASKGATPGAAAAVVQTATQGPAQVATDAKTETKAE